jgi:hypothetical protein
VEYVGIGASGSAQDVKSVICSFDDVKRRAPPERGAKPADAGEGGQLVARSLQEQHRNPDVRQVVPALRAPAAARMQRESEEHERLDPANRGLGLSLGRHPATHRFSPSDQPEFRRQSCRGAGRSADGIVQERGAVGTANTTFHVRKIETERGHRLRGELARDGNHERMIHAGAGTVREHQQCSSLGRAGESGRDVDAIARSRNVVDVGHGDAMSLDRDHSRVTCG